MNLAILMIVTAFSFIVLASIPSERLYAQFFPSPSPSPNIPDSDNSLKQDCSQTAIGKEITQTQECQQQRDTNDNDNDGFCPAGYYRNSLGFCVPLLQLNPLPTN